MNPLNKFHPLELALKDALDKGEYDYHHSIEPILLWNPTRWDLGNYLAVYAWGFGGLELSKAAKLIDNIPTEVKHGFWVMSKYIRQVRTLPPHPWNDRICLDSYIDFQLAIQRIHTVNPYLLSVLPRLAVSQIHEYLLSPSLTRLSLEFGLNNGMIRDDVAFSLESINAELYCWSAL